LVALLATIDPDDPLGASKKLAVRDTRPNAAVCYCAVLSLHERDRLSETVVALMGRPESEDPAAYRAASPVDRVSGREPPFLLLHGDADELVPLSQSRRMHALLGEASVPAELVVLGGVEHGFGYGVRTEAQRQAAAHVERFLAARFAVRSAEAGGSRE
jgi:acetyl esterase/lipase